MGLILDADQQVAVNTREGAWVDISGPGSGKTRVLVERFMALLKAGVSTDEILSLTFTEQAAKEMGQRGGFGSSQSLFRTFHSFCLSILKRERSHLPFELNSDIVGSQPEVFELICELRRIYRHRFTYQELVEGIAQFKRQGLGPEEAMEQAEGDDAFLAWAYRDYEKKSLERGWLDFDSLIIEAVKLLESNPDVRSRYQFKYVQVDEGQDTDINQFKLLQLITQKYKNIFVVGDENQLIYEWRAAMPGSLSSLSRLFPGIKVLYQGTNYRSTKRLVSFFKKIVPVDNGLASHMRPGSNNEEGVDPNFVQYKHDLEEMDSIVKYIQVLVRLNGMEYLDKVAILARTNRQLWPIENMCLKNNIKYRLLGRIGFWDQDEVRRVVSLAKDTKGFLMPAGQIVKNVIDANGLIQTYKRHVKFGEKDPAENIDTVWKISQRFDTLDEFLKYANRASHAHRNQAGLVLSTVHQMKGKEADTVFLIGCNQGTLPHIKGDIAEERRIFFVACSRAAKHLHISYYGNPSEFIVPYLIPGQNGVLGSQARLF